MVGNFLCSLLRPETLMFCLPCSFAPLDPIIDRLATAHFLLEVHVSPGLCRITAISHQDPIKTTSLLLSVSFTPSLYPQGSPKQIGLLYASLAPGYCLSCAPSRWGFLSPLLSASALVPPDLRGCLPLFGSLCKLHLLEVLCLTFTYF